MTELFTDTVLNMMTTTAEPEDYTGEDGLLYCGKCRTAKEAYFPKETAAWLGHDKHPTECDCQREKRLECESAEERRRHLDTVMELKRRGFTDLTMQEWTFAHDNGKCLQMSKAHLYVEHWEQMRENNYGLLLWGKVGTGKRGTANNTDLSPFSCLCERTWGAGAVPSFQQCKSPMQGVY